VSGDAMPVEARLGMPTVLQEWQGRARCTLFAVARAREDAAGSPPRRRGFVAVKLTATTIEQVKTHGWERKWRRRK
jgi:hypothetical protein